MNYVIRQHITSSRTVMRVDNAPYSSFGARADAQHGSFISCSSEHPPRCKFKRQPQYTVAFTPQKQQQQQQQQGQLGPHHLAVPAAAAILHTKPGKVCNLQLVCLLNSSSQLAASPTPVSLTLPALSSSSTTGSSCSTSSTATLQPVGESDWSVADIAGTAVAPAMATAAAAAPPAAAAAPTGGLLGSPATAAAVHNILGTTIPLNQITQVKMVMGSTCKMGISFWPSFRFKPPERDEKAGTANIINAAEVPPEMTAANTSSSSSSSSGKLPSVSSQLLHVNFTQEPPDEFSVGAKFLGGIPFPFITIRTTRLEGTIDPFTGAVVLLFEAQFLAGMGGKKPTALTVNANLTTEPAAAFKKTMEGKRLDQGHVMLVSAAEVPKTSSWFANLILWLPTAATAVLPMRLEFS